MEKRGDRIVETATEARGGRPGVPVLKVLIAAIALVAVLYVALYMGFFA